MDKAEFNRINKNFEVDETTLIYAITPRLAGHFAQRFRGLVVLETCSGAGFLTIELAKVAKKVLSVEIDEQHLRQAQHNVKTAEVEKAVEFIQGDILSESVLKRIPQVDAAILDPAWNDQVLSHMSPPADLLFEAIRKKTENIAFILPPNTSEASLVLFPPHEREMLYLDGQLALLCLYFGTLAKQKESVFKA